MHFLKKVMLVSSLCLASTIAVGGGASIVEPVGDSDPEPIPEPISSYGTAFDLDLVYGVVNEKNVEYVFFDAGEYSVTDIFNFTLENDAEIEQSIRLNSYASLGWGFFLNSDIRIDSFAIYDSSGGIVQSVDEFVIEKFLLSSGSYTTKIDLSVNTNPDLGGFDFSTLNYTLKTTISPVPEASTLAMMLGGLGFVGFMAARRKVSLT